MSIKGFHLHLPQDDCPRVFYILFLKLFTGLNLIPLNSHLNLPFDHYNCNISSSLIFTLIPSERTHDSMLPMTIRQPYGMNNLYWLNVHTHITILGRVGIIDNMTRLYHISRGRSGLLLFRSLLVLFLKIPLFTVIVILPISSLYKLAACCPLTFDLFPDLLHPFNQRQLCHNPLIFKQCAVFPKPQSWYPPSML